MVLEEKYGPQASVIGCLLIDPDALAGEIFRAVSPEDFWDATMRTIFIAARNRWLERKPLDVVTIASDLGPKYNPILAQAMQETPTCVNWRDYCKLVRNTAALKKMQVIGMQLMSAENVEEARELLAQAEGLVLDRPKFKITSYGTMLSDFLDRQEDKRPSDFLDWGIPQLNDKLSISPGRFVILAADSSVGKTAFALQIAYNVARTGKRVGFFSLETAATDAADRLVANTADVSLPTIKRKRLHFEDIARVAKEGSENGNISFELIEAAGATVEDIRAITLSRRYDVILIDYVQLIPTKGADRWQQVSANSMALHTMSQQLGVTVIGLSQVTPVKTASGNRRELDRENLRESRQLILDAEAILIMDLSDPKDYSSNRILKIDKNKDGPCGRLLLEFEPTHMRFKYIPPFEDDKTRRSRERYEKMDVNAAAKKLREESGASDPNQMHFRELADDSPVPFEECD